MESISPHGADSAIDPRTRRAEAFYAGTQAVCDMAFDSYCPRRNYSLPRRECVQCVAEVALDAYEAVLFGEVR